MTYDKKTRRTSRAEKLKYGVIVLAVGATGAIAAAALSLHRYWDISPDSSFGQWFAALENTDYLNEQGKPFPKAIEELGLNANLNALFSQEQPLWTLDSPYSAEERQKAFQERLKKETHKGISTSKYQRRPVNVLTESTTRHGAQLLLKPTISLLPGEALVFPRENSERAPKTLLARCLGAPADRRDMPLKIAIESAGGASEKQISPRGDLAEIEIPHATGREIRLSWDRNAPCTLAILGAPAVRPKTPGVVFFSIDSLPTGFAALPRTQSALKEIYGSKVSALYRTWPTSENTQTNMAALMLGQYPVNLGALVPNPELQNVLSSTRGKPLENAFNAKNLETYRIKVTGDEVCSVHECASQDTFGGILGSSLFRATMQLNRNRELEQALARFADLKADDFLGRFYHIDISFPEEQFGLTWKSAQTNSNWINLFPAAIFKRLLPHQFHEAHAFEKSRQIDESMARLIRAMDRQNPPALGILIQKTDSIPNPEIYGHEISARPGEFILAAASQPNTEATKSSPQQIYSQLSLHDTLLSLPETATPPQPVDLASVQYADREVFVLPSGWLSLSAALPGQIRQNTSDKHGVMHVNFANLPRIRALIDQQRKKYTLHAIHVLASDAPRGSLLSLSLSTDTPVIACAGAGNQPVDFKQQKENAVYSVYANLRAANQGIPALTCFQDLEGSAGKLPAISISTQIDTTVLSPAEIAVGEFALGGQIFAGTQGGISLNEANRGHFAYARLAPDPQEFPNRKVFVWMSEYGSSPDARSFSVVPGNNVLNNTPPKAPPPPAPTATGQKATTPHTEEEMTEESTDDEVQPQQDNENAPASTEEEDTSQDTTE